jgi:8-oxo-dGTP pyrophosphatase MutT (NUDIX family)
MAQFPNYWYASAGGGIVVRGGRVLLIRKRLPPEVRIPKGHIDRGEEADQTALREVAEETGYSDLRILANLGGQQSEFDHGGRHVVRDESCFLLAMVTERQVSRTEHDASRFEPTWVPLDSAPSLLTFPTEQEFARRAAVWLAKHPAVMEEVR